MQLYIYHCEFGLVEILEKPTYRILDSTTICTTDVLGTTIKTERSLIQYPDGFQTQNPAEAFIVSYQNDLYVSPLCAFGTYREAAAYTNTILLSYTGSLTADPSA